MKKIKPYAIISILSGALLFLNIMSFFSIGEIINRFYPCEQNPQNSFPCFGIYDMYFMILLLAILIISLTIAIIKIIKSKNKK